MGNRLFQRAIKVTIWEGKPSGFAGDNPTFFETASNAIEITGLRMQFSIKKSLDSTPNEAELTITNASSATRDFLKKKPLVVEIAAGYDDTPRHLFTGDVRWSFSQPDGANWTTKLQMGDGDRAYRYARATRSYKKGTQVVQVLREIAGTMGLQLARSVNVSTDLQAQFATGHSIVGPARDELTRLLAIYGYHWSIQNGVLQVLKDQDPNEQQAFVWNQSTGMLGSPTFSTPDQPGKPSTLNSSSLLYPEVIPGSRVSVESLDVNGVFRPTRVNHEGDTHGGEWTTEIEATPTTETRA